MKELNELNVDKTIYYLLDNARVHKSKKFNEYIKESNMTIVYNAPYTQDKKFIFYLVRTMNKHKFIHWVSFRNKSYRKHFFNV